MLCHTGYFNNGALTKVEAAEVSNTPATSTEFDYDKMGRVVKHRNSIGSQSYNLEYGYNLAGQLTSEKYPSGKVVSMNYDANGRLSSIADNARSFLSGVSFNSQTLPSQINFGNGTNQTFAYNDRLQMTQQNLSRGSEVLQKYDYGYGQIDASGNLDLTKNNGQLAKVESYIGANKQWTQKFSYDSLGRLSEAKEYRGDTSALSYKQKFDFDRFGNLYRKTSSNPTAGQATPLLYTPIEDSDISKSTNRFTTNTVYDDAGNVTQDTKFRNQNFFYDANGRMFKTSSTVGPNQANSVYDASGMRVATQVDNVWTFFVYDVGGKMVAEYGGLQSTDEGGVKYVLQDWQGSSRAIVSNSGFVQARMDYTAFGEEIYSGTGQRTTAQGFNAVNNLNQKYAQTERDKATGLDHTWFRKNENKAGRWTSPDPYGGSASVGNPQSWNKYGYVQNQPTNFVDPSGLLLIFCQFYANFYYPNGFDNPEGRTQIGNSWLVCSIESGGGGGNGGRQTNIDLPGGGGTTLRPEEKDKEQSNKFSNCVQQKVARIQRDLAVDVNGIESRALNQAGAVFSLALLALTFEGVLFLTGVGTLPSIYLAVGTIILGAIGVAAAYTIAVSEKENARTIAQNQTNDAFEDCAKENNVTLGPAPVPAPPLPRPR